MHASIADTEKTPFLCSSLPDKVCILAIWFCRIAVFFHGNYSSPSPLQLQENISSMENGLLIRDKPWINTDTNANYYHLSSGAVFLAIDCLLLISAHVQKITSGALYFDLRTYCGRDGVWSAGNRTDHFEHGGCSGTSSIKFFYSDTTAT